MTRTQADEPHLGRLSCLDVEHSIEDGAVEGTRTPVGLSPRAYKTRPVAAEALLHKEIGLSGYRILYSKVRASRVSVNTYRPKDSSG